MLSVLESRVAEWYSQRYAGVSDLEVIAKLIEEIGELQMALIERDSDSIAEESADVCIVLMSLLREFHGTTLLAEVNQKVAEIELR